MTHTSRVHSIYFALGLGTALTLSSLGHAAADGVSIVRKGEEQMRGQTAQALMTMKIVRPSFERQLTLRVWTEGNQKALVEILKPAKEEAITSLRTEDQMWNYLPKTDQIVRVPTSLMLQSWMGSDFTNDDLMKMSSITKDYTHRIVRQEKLEGVKTTLIECIPKPTAPVVWGKILYWARQSDSLPMKEEYYDEGGNLIRTMTLGAFKKMDDRIIPTELTIQKAGAAQEKTIVTYERILFDRALGNTLFQQSNLKNASRKGLDLDQGWLTLVKLAAKEGA